MEQITYLNDRQVADMLGCSTSKLRNDRHLGQGLPYRKINRLKTDLISLRRKT